MSNFKFNLNLTKAYEKDGRKHVTAEVSDTTLDAHGEHMSEKSIDSMTSFLKGGDVWLIESHGSTMKQGVAVDGWNEKSSDGVIHLYSDFALEDTEFANLLYKDVESGKCAYQLSVGGKATGKHYYSDIYKKNVVELVDVDYLEHVACTRPNRAAVSGTGFISALMKGIEDTTPIEKEIKIQGEYIPMDAKTEQELLNNVKAQGEALATLTKSLETLTAASAAKTTTEPVVVTPVTKAVTVELEADPNVQKYIAKQKAQADSEKASAEAIAKAVDEAVSKAVTPIADLIKGLGQTLPRVRAGIPVGAHVVSKEAQTLTVPGENDTSDSDKKRETIIKDIDALRAEGLGLSELRKGGNALSPVQNLRATKIAEEMNKKEAQLSAMNYGLV